MRRFTVVLKEHMTINIASEISTLLHNKIGKPVWLDTLHDKRATFGYNGHNCDIETVNSAMTEVFVIFNAEAVQYGT